MSEFLVQLGKRLKSLREEKNVDQETVANLLKVGKSSISLYENGKNAPPLETINILCNYYNVTADYLINGIGDVTNNYLLIGASSTGKSQILKKIFSHDFRNQTKERPVTKIFEMNDYAMKPAIMEHDTVLCESVSDWEEIVDNKICAVIDGNEKTWIRRVINKIKQDETIILTGEVTIYPAMKLSVSNIKEIWEVVARASAHFDPTSTEVERRLIELKSGIENDVYTVPRSSFRSNKK